MSMHSSGNTDPTPQGEDPITDAVQETPEERQRREFLESVADNREEIDHLYLHGTRITSEVPVVPVSEGAELQEPVEDAGSVEDAEGIPPTREERRARIAGIIASTRAKLAESKDSAPRVFTETPVRLSHRYTLTPEELAEYGPTTTYIDPLGNIVTTLRDPRDPNQRYDPKK